MSLTTEMRDLVRKAASRGWEAQRSRGGHWRLAHPVAGGPVFLAMTPSDHRALQNSRLELIRHERAAGLLLHAESRGGAPGESPGEKLLGCGGRSQQLLLLLRDFTVPPRPPRLATQQDVIAGIQAFAAELGVSWSAPAPPQPAEHKPLAVTMVTVMRALASNRKPNGCAESTPPPTSPPVEGVRRKSRPQK